MKYVVTPMIVEIFNAPESIVKRNVSRARIFLRESERISFSRIELSLLQVSDELQLDSGTCASLFSKQGRVKVWDFLLKSDANVSSLDVQCCVSVDFVKGNI